MILVLVVRFVGLNCGGVAIGRGIDLIGVRLGVKTIRSVGVVCEVKN